MTVYILIFLVMLSLPVVSALVYMRTRECKTLLFRQDYVKDVRFFGHSFSQLSKRVLKA